MFHTQLEVWGEIMPLVKIIPSHLDETTVQNIVRYFARKKLRIKFCRPETIDTIYKPYYVFLFEGQIKRAFNLPARRVPMSYIIDGYEGKLFKLSSLPEIEVQELDPTSVKLWMINMDEAEKKAKDLAYVYLRRSFRSFWAPSIEIQEKELVYIPVYVQTIVSNGDKHQVFVNSFTGEPSVS